jgi:Fe-S oxidoreductase
MSDYSCPSNQLVEFFLAWLLRAIHCLEEQVEMAEQVKTCLTCLDIESSVPLIQKQQSFLSEAQVWYLECVAHWEGLGYKHSPLKLSDWIAQMQPFWLSSGNESIHEQVRTLLSAWDHFCGLLKRLELLNKINQHLVEQASQDTRRKLYALMQYAGIGNGAYTSEGSAQALVLTSGAVSGGSLGSLQGRLLGKG